MIQNCALYFPIAKLPLKKHFPEGKGDGYMFRSPTWFEYPTSEGVVRLNLQHDDLMRHLDGLSAYVAQLPNSGAARSQTQELIRSSKAAVGVILPQPVETDSDAFQSLVGLIDRFAGFMFVYDSVMLPDGTFLVGPMAEEDLVVGGTPPELICEIDPDDCRQTGDTEGVDPDRLALRENHYYQLAQRGFRCARWLPLYRESRDDELRPISELASRLLALKALFLWAAAPDDIASSDRIETFVSRNGLMEHLTEDEATIISAPRDQAREEHRDSIGWRLENMWSLAWVLGFEPCPPFYQGQIPQQVFRDLIEVFLPNLDGSIDDFLAELQPRSTADVVGLEDLYYCTHNAVRSAQMGSDTVPDYFHPVGDGGAIHERRHSLTWALSPGAQWDETDLST